MDVVICDKKYILNPLHELTCHVSLSAGRHKCHMKRCLEFKKNTIGHTTFVWWMTCQPETWYAHYSFRAITFCICDLILFVL